MTNKKIDYSLLDSFEIQGKWWISDDVDSKFDGILYALQNIKILKLDKSSSIKILNLANTSAGFTIHGVDEQKNKWSLLKCYPGNHNFPNSYSTLDITVNELVKNAHITSFDEIKVDEFELSYSSLAESCLDRSPYKANIDKNQLVNCIWLPPESFEVSLLEFD